MDLSRLLTTTMSGRFKQIILLVGDAGFLYLALFGALALRFQKWPSGEIWTRHWPSFTVVFFLWLIVFYLSGLYDLRRTKNNLKFFGAFLMGLGINLLLAIGVFYLISLPQLSPKTILILLSVLYFPLFLLWRFAFHSFLRAGALGNRLLFLGYNKEVEELIKTFLANPQLGYLTTGIYTGEETVAADGPAAGVRQINEADLTDYLKNKKADTIILADKNWETRLSRPLYEAILSGINVYQIDSFFENITHRVPLSAISEGWFLENLSEPQKTAYNLIKRLIDATLSFLMLTALIIFFAPVALIIFFYDRGQIFYKQTRVGKDGRIFTIFKFRTMVENAETAGPQFTKINDKRVTPVGKILRLLRLDELPQAINILKNEMSFIGPRPERPEFVEEIQKLMPFYRARHLVKPGLTGWAQVNHSYTDSFEGNLLKLQFDLFYIKNRSLLVDAITLLKTINTIIKRTGR